ncbi:Nesprin-2 [Rhizoctonia solani]|uniref:Nesprin-2 n=1 Tax=Rhizoctonia solani TaxID=456999 RepID=A0A0K6FP08_9AGAM|nr:Nesprin-2 [Rhizoctonia solani]
MKDIILDAESDFERMSLYPIVPLSMTPLNASNTAIASATIRASSAPGLMYLQTNVNKQELSTPSYDVCDFVEDYRSGSVLDVIGSVGGLFALLQAMHVLLFGRPLLWGLTGAKLITPFGLLGTCSSRGFRRRLREEYHSTSLDDGTETLRIVKFLRDFVIEFGPADFDANQQPAERSSPSSPSLRAVNEIADSQVCPPKIVYASPRDWESLKDNSSEEEIISKDSEPTHDEIKLSLISLIGRPYEFQDFDESHLVLARALSITPDGDSSATLIYEIYDNLCSSYAQRVQDADQHYYSTPLVLKKSDDPERSYEYGIAHRAQFERDGSLERLAQSIGCLNTAVNLAKESHPELPKYLFALADALINKFERFSQVEFLEEAIGHQRRAVNLSPNIKPRWLGSLGFALMRRFRVVGNLADLDEAIQLEERAVACMKTDTERPDRCYNDLAMSLVYRFEYASNPLDLDRAIELYERTLQLDIETEVRAETATNIGIALQLKYLHFIERDLIDQAIEYQQQAVDSTPDAHTDKPGYLSNLALSLQHRFEHLGEMEDIDRAISHQLEALTLLPKKHSLRPGILNNLGKSYLQRFINTGEPTDIERCLQHLLSALEMTIVGSPDRPRTLDNLGHAFREKFESQGRLVDIDRAIEYHYEAASKTPQGHMDQAERLDHLGSAYTTRFERLEELADIDNAIEQYRAALAIYGPRNKKAQATLNNLGIALSRRFAITRQTEDNNESILVLREAIAISAKQSYMPILQSSLGSFLLSRYQLTNQLEDITESVSCLEQAVALSADDHPDMAVWLHQLCTSLSVRYSRYKNTQDVINAVECQTRAVSLIQESHPDRLAMLFSLGDTLLLQQLALGDPHAITLGGAIKAYKQAAQSIVGTPIRRFEAAHKWAQALSLQKDSPIEAFKLAFSLIPQLVWIGTTIDQRYKNITFISRLTTRAVASAIAEGAYSLALEWFEEGRSIVWRQMLQLRTPMDELRAVDPSLADKLDNVAQQLDRAGSSKPIRSNLGARANIIEKEAQSRRRLAEDWERLFVEVRQLNGFSDFLQSKKADVLLKAARDGAVVAINIHINRCDALVIRHDGSLDCVPLPDLSFQKALDAQKQLMKTLNLAGVRHRSGAHATSKNQGVLGRFKGLWKPILRVKLRAPKALKSLNNGQSFMGSSNRTNRRPFTEEANSPDKFGKILEFLWVDIVRPILAHLQYLDPKPGDLPHTTGCVTGPLAFLPLHAAGSYINTDTPSRVFDCVVLSYTPTLNGLLASAPSTGDFSGILTIGQTSTPGFSELPGTEKELRIISQHAKPLRFTELMDQAATPHTVLEAINSHSWVHFACHASQIPQDPTSSAFYLHQGTLDLNTITQQSLGKKAFAFLSACQTATGDIDFPEEAVHLAAGMIMVGYPTVIATMWSIGDSDAPLIAEHTYAEMLADGNPDSTKASRALHRALGILRDRVGEDAFVSWVPYIHVGI